MIRNFGSVLKNKQFVFLWVSQLFSQLTIQFMNFLVLIRIYEHTTSTIATAFIWVAFALPAMLLGPLASALVDLVDRKTILMLTNFLQALTILVYAFTFQRSLFLSYVVVLVYSLFNQFYVPAEAASVPFLVERKKLPQANGLFFLTQQAAIVAGFSLAGILNAVIGYQDTFLIASGLLFLAFVSVSFLQATKTKDELLSNLEKGYFEFFQEIVAGIRFIKNNKNILMPILLLMGMQTALTIIVVSLPVIATDILEVSPNSAGIYLVAPATIGAIIGTLATTKLLASKRKKKVIEMSLTGLTAGIWGIIFMVPLIDLPLRFLISTLFLVLTGVCFVGVLIPAQTYLQETTPGGLMGRVFGNFWFLTTIVTVVPVVFSGTMIELFGVKLLFFLIGFSTIIIYELSNNYGEKILVKPKKSSGMI